MYANNWLIYFCNKKWLDDYFYFSKKKDKFDIINKVQPQKSGFIVTEPGYLKFRIFEGIFKRSIIFLMVSLAII